MRAQFSAPYAVLHRADLAEALYKATRRFANIDIIFGVRDWRAQAHDDGANSAEGVSLSIESGEKDRRTIRGAALLGADGVHSQTRQNVLMGPAARFTGRIAWRGLVPLSAIADILAPDRMSVFFASGHHLVCYPLPHRDQANLVLFLPAGSPEQKRPAPRRGGPVFDALLAAAENEWTTWPLNIVTTPTWQRGAVAILGDAAHAMLPFQAQGAAMGIEDAAVLAPLLMESPQAGPALARFAELRQPRLRRVATLSRNNGRIFHLRQPLSFARDAVMRLQGPQAHLKRLGWVYGYRVPGG